MPDASSARTFWALCSTGDKPVQEQRTPLLKRLAVEKYQLRAVTLCLNVLACTSSEGLCHFSGGFSVSSSRTSYSGITAIEGAEVSLGNLGTATFSNDGFQPVPQRVDR